MQRRAVRDYLRFAHSHHSNPREEFHAHKFVGVHRDPAYG